MNKRTRKWFLLLFALLLPLLGWAQDQEFKQDGLIYTFDTDHFELTGYDAEEFNGYLYVPYDIWYNNRWYRVSKLKPGALDGLTNVISVNFYAYVDEIPADFFKGIGSQENPVIAYFEWGYLPRYEKTFSDHVCQLAGGFFNLFMDYRSNGFELKYQLVADYEYWLTDITIYDNEQLELVIETRWNDAILTKVEPEVVAKWKKATDRIKKVIIYGENKPDIDADAFAGIGTADAPADITMSREAFANWGGDPSNGQLLGGYFSMVRSEWGGNYISNITYRLTDNGYVLSDPVQFEKGDYEYSLYLRVHFDDTDVTEIKADAFKDIRENISNMNFTEVVIDGISNTLVIEDGTFAGFGTDENPIKLNIATALLTKIGKVTANGNYEIAGGYFMAGKTYYYGDFVVTYVPNENGYTVAKVVEQEESQSTIKTLQINYAIWEYYDGYEYETPITAVAENAFEGIGTAEAPVRLILYKSLAQKFGAKTENGITTLAGGFFELGYTSSNYNEGVNIFYKLEDDGLSYTAKGYTQDMTDYFRQQHPEGYKITIIDYISDYNGVEWVEGIPVNKIAPDAFKDIKDVYAVKITTPDLTIPEDAFSGIGTAENPANLDVSIPVLKRLNPPTENGLTRLGGGYFEIAYIYYYNNVNIIYSFVDDHYELKNVTPRYSSSEYNIRVVSQINQYWDVETQKWINPQVTKIRANAFSTLGDKIASINIDGTNIEIEDGAFNGVGSLEKPASITASNTILKAALGEKLAEGIYNIKGGVFAMNALTIKAQKNPDGKDYAITYAYIDGARVFSYESEQNEEGVWVPKPGTYDLMDVPADGSDYYTYTFLSAKRISDLQISILDENNRPDYLVYNNKVSLNITGDTIFVWREDKNRLYLKDAPEEYDFWLGDVFVTAANADDIFAGDQANAGKAKYDAETNTLTLDGVDVQSWRFVNNENYGLKIVLKGDNTFRPYKDDQWGYVELYNYMPLTFTGNGTLNIIGSNMEVTEPNGSWGYIYNGSDLTITGGARLNISRIWEFSNEDYFKLTIDRGLLSISEVKSDYALRAQGLTVGEGTKILIPEGAKINEEGILCDAEGNYAKTVKIGCSVGDANNDGIVDAADIVEVANAIMGMPSERFNPIGADVNNDGTINAADIVAIAIIVRGN